MQKLKNAMHSGANAATAQVERIRLAVEPVVFQSQLAAYSALGTAMNTGERLVGVAQLAKDAGVVTAHQGMQAVKDGVEDAKQAVELVADQAKLRVYSAMGTALDANESLVNGFKFAQDSARYSSFGNAVIGAGVFIGATGLVWAGVREHSKRKEAKAVEQAAADQAAAGPVVLDANTFMPQGVVGGRSIARELQDLARSKLEGGALDELSILNPSGKTQAPCTQLTALTGGVPFEKFALSGPERTIWAQICKVAEGVFELLTGNY
jgi:hypothetical protein